jgi:hypothetical protein
VPGLGQRAKSEVALARRLRQETTIKLKLDGLTVGQGSWTYVSNLLCEQ